MTTRTPTGRAIEVPDVVGDKADEAIQRLRELGLMPITYSAEVPDVNEAGFVLGIDPPAGTQVRPKAAITISVAAHPDFQGHADDVLIVESDQPVQTPLTWPLSGPTGLESGPVAPAEPLTIAFETSATPGAPSAPASSPIDAASRENRHDHAAASSAVQPTSGVAADPYLPDLEAPVPTPDAISAEDDWDRLRAAEAARHAASGPSATEPAAEPVAALPSEDDTQRVDEEASADTADALEEQARREASRRRARRRRHLSFKQKAMVVAVLAFTVLIAVAAVSGHKPAPTPPHVQTQTRSHRDPRPAHAKSALTSTHHRHPAPKHHRPARATSRTAGRRRARSRRHPAVARRSANRTRVTTVTVQAPVPSVPAANSGAPAAPVNTPPAATAPVATGSGPTTTAAPPASAPVASAPSQQPPSAPSTSGSHSSGTSGGTTLQSPDGTTAPPKP